MNLLRNQITSATSRFDITPSLKLFSLTEKVGLIFAFFYIYLISIISTFFTIEKVSRNQNASYRLSLQSQMGFGVEPSTLTIITCFSITILFFVMFIIALQHKSAIPLVKLFGEMVFPSALIFSVTLIGFVFGRIDLRLPIFSMDEISKNLWVSTSWAGVTSFGIAIIISAGLAIVLFRKNQSDLETPKMSSFIPWLIPIIINTGFLAALTSASKNYDRFLIWFTIIPNLILLILFAIYTLNRKFEQLVLTIVLCASIFVYLFSYRPTQVVTWRPELQLKSIADERYFFFSLLISIIVGIFLLLVTNFYYWVPVVVAGLWGGLGSRVNSTVVSSLDNFHYGELMGYWLGFSEFDQLPYKSVEFPRGVLVNVIPAAFGDFLSNGYPETFTYWFVFLSFLLGVVFFLVAKCYMPISAIFFLLILLPKPNGYYEIDLIMGIIVLGFVAILQRIKSYNTLFFFAPLFAILLILLTPGQGLICIALLLFIALLHFRQNRISLRFLLSWPWVVYFMGVSVLAAILTLPSLLWVVRNGGVNNVMYGDNWLGRIFIPQQFPLSLKFGILLLAPLLLTILLIKLPTLKNFQKQLGFAAVIYLIAISGRWFGRVDQQDMSRIGAGLFLFTIIFILPLTLRRSTSDRISFAGFLSLTLTISLAIAFLPFNQSINFQQVPSSSTLSGQSLEMHQRGEIYKRIKNLETGIYGARTKRLNLTGGQAIDQYLGTRSIGGIESPYVITNDAQETAWKSRLEKSGVNIVLGPYGSLGAGAFDGSGIGGRAPQVLSWIINRFTPVDCGLFIIAIRKSDFNEKVGYLNSQGCVAPANGVELLSLWNRIDATQSNLGWSLVSWKSNKTLQNQSLDKISSSINVSLPKSTDLLAINLRCSSPQLVDFYIESSIYGEIIRQVFSAQVQSGAFNFKPGIFPITTISGGKFTLRLNSANCSFI